MGDWIRPKPRPTPPPRVATLAIWAKDDQTGLPIAGALVDCLSLDPPVDGVTNQDGYFALQLTTGRTHVVEVHADRYPSVVKEILLTGNRDVSFPLTAAAPPVPVRPPVIVRSPLPAMPPGAYDRVLPWDPPKVRDYLRADAWSVPVPGLPFVPGLPGSGGSSEHPERLLTGLDYKYDRARWPAMLQAHAERGYTHWVRWYSNARVDGGNSIEQFVDDCLRIKEVIPYVVVSLGSKVFEPRDMSVEAWKRYAGPILDALFKAGAADEIIPAFEWDSFNVPGPTTIAACKWIGQQAHAAGASCWLHFLPEHTSWFADGDSRGRFGFYDDLGADIDGLNYQGDPAWSIQELQARMVDTLWQFGTQRWGHKLRAFELVAETQFTHDHPDEDEGNQIGYLACCTVDNVKHTDAKLWGFGNGARRPDGTAL